MEIETVTAADFGLLNAIRATLRGADDAYLCVAFAHERGIQLIGRELDELQNRKRRMRILVTTVSDRAGITGGARGVARAFGVAGTRTSSRILRTASASTIGTSALRGAIASTRRLVGVSTFTI